MQKRYPADPILITDDEEQFLSTVTFLLKGAGINNIIICSDSRKVPLLLKQQVFSVIILDLLMPHVTGDMLLMEIMNDHSASNVIMISTIDDSEMTADAWHRERDFFLLSPCKATDSLMSSGSVSQTFPDITVSSHRSDEKSSWCIPWSC